MTQPGDNERKTQNRVVKLFKTLGYRYLGNWEYRPDNSNLELEILRTWLVGRGVSKALIDRALFEFGQAVRDQSGTLYDRNRKVYELLRYGVKVKTAVGENTQTVWLIDWAQPSKNDFAIAEEVTVRGGYERRQLLDRCPERLMKLPNSSAQMLKRAGGFGLLSV